MIFNMYEHELMKLCGICRYLPTGLLRKYDAPYLSRSVIVGLQKFGVIKTQSDKGSYKLTTKGRDYLAEMGFEFSDDIRMDLKRPIYKRKLKNAFWNITLSLAGIDIYHSRTRELAEKDVGYVSSLVIRADKCTKVLAGTKFLGILKIFNTAYIPYCVENENTSIIPGYEREIYRSQAEAAKGIKEIRVIVTGETLEELWNHIHPDSQGEKLLWGMKRIGEALEELGSEYLLVPYTCDGVMQLGFLKSYRNRERLAKALGCETTPNPQLSDCDGILDKTPYIIAIDFNVNRIIRALKQIERIDKSIIPKICCLPFQKSTMFKLLKLYGCQKSIVMTVNKNDIYNVFPEFKKEPVESRPYVTEEGKYIDTNT